MLRRLRQRVASFFGNSPEQDVLGAADALDEMMSDFEEEQGEEALRECLANNDNLGDVVDALEENSSLSAEDYAFPEDTDESDAVAFDP